ncbi:putative snare protein Ykt6 [Sporormia fimetaria CBS 119925]|uniref:Putative snare protein Ykt6 n=1 Tax=Sporormia fimetaria CBS 119925 TaxID=1340428 RepID=A0A6A6V9Z5_9PLEO|nr:putative snare protein Ykt6 [Sporormia fimetaria CBS 119925]
MKITYLGVLRNSGRKEKPLELAVVRDLSSMSRFTHGSMEELQSFAATLVAARAKLNVGLRVEEEGLFVHICRTSKPICAVMITDEEYPDRVAQGVLRSLEDIFLVKYKEKDIEAAKKANSLRLPELDEYIAKYQNPENVDPIMMIQKELNESKVVLHQTIESVLERGEKIDVLVAKSEGLSSQSKMFYTQAKKQNSCCSVM